MKDTLEENNVSSVAAQPRRYRPSWIDRFTDWVERMPGPSWIYYLGIGLALVLVQAISPMIEGFFPKGKVIPAQIFLAGAIAFLLALFHYLEKWAGAALVSLRPALKVSEEEIQELHYQLTTLPAGRTLLASLATLTIVFIAEWIGGPYRPVEIVATSISADLTRFIYLVCWWIFGAYMYHTVHQLKLINKIYTGYTRVNIFRMKPFYAFSNLSAFTAGSLAALPYGFLIVNPGEWKTEFVSVVIILGITILAVVTFIWPQLGMHRIQESEQERMVDQAYMRLEATISELHRQLDEKDYEGMESLNFAINSLEIELNTLKGVRTWPWEPETLQILITALALPLGLWFIQFIMERVFGS
jgi:hypothetical protein